MINKLTWDSDFFGYNIGKFTVENTQFDEINFKEESKNFQLVYLFSNQEINVSDDLKLVDIKTTFEKKINTNIVDNKSITSFDSEIHYYEELKELVYLSGTFSRFKIDENFRNNEFEKLYKIWLDNSLDFSFAFQVLVKIIDEKIAGFVTLKEYNNETSEIGLIAVSNDFQGKGIASELIKKVEYESFIKGYKFLRVPTQYENKPAVKLYLKNGFEIIEKTYIYHYWNK